MRVNLRCKHLNRAEDLSRYFGFSKTKPFDKVANVFIPTSMEELERRERDLERRERELERNERELEKRQRHHEREDEMYRKGWFGERDIRDEYDGTEPYMRRGRRSRYY